MAICITSDSTCDLGEQLEKWGVEVIPLNVVLDTETYLDGVNIHPTEIFAFVERTKQLPKTSARSVHDYEDFFEEKLKGYDSLVH